MTATLSDPHVAQHVVQRHAGVAQGLSHAHARLWFRAHISQKSVQLRHLLAYPNAQCPN